MRNRMLTAVAAAAIASTVGLSGCTSSSGTSDAGSGAEQAKSAAAGGLRALDAKVGTYSDSDKGIYLATLRTEKDFAGLTDQNLLRVGTSVCLLFEKGQSLHQVANFAIAYGDASGLTTNDSADLTSAAVVNFCPSYTADAGG